MQSSMPCCNMLHPCQCRMPQELLLRPQGVPPYLRHSVWFENCGATALRAAHRKQHFAECVRAGLGRPSVVRQIELDISRTYPEHPFFRGEEGLTKLRTVLLAYAGHNREVGYCQSMNYVAGILLLVLDRDPEDSFWVLAALIGGMPSLLLAGNDLQAAPTSVRAL